MKVIKEYITSVRLHKKRTTSFVFRIKDLAFLLPHAKNKLWSYVRLCFIFILGSCLSLPSPAITGYIIDSVFVNKNIARLNLLVGLLFIILIISELVRTAQDYSLLRLSQEFTFSVRMQLIRRILAYPLSFFRDYRTGYLVSRLDEVSLLGNFFSATVIMLGDNLIRFIGAVILISRYNTKLTIISLFILPFFFEISRRSVGVIRASSVGAMESSAIVRGKIQETLAGIETVKTYAKEGQETSEIRSGLRKMLEIDVFQNLFSSIAGKVLGLFTGINLLLILWVGGHEIIKGRLTVGQYFAFVTYIGFLYGPIQTVVIAFLQFQRTFMACNRISEFLKNTAGSDNCKRTYEYSTIAGNINFEDVYYQYENGNDVLKGISFNIHKGEKVAFVGKSGAGKSTLVYLILGLYEPTAGRVKIDDIDIQKVNVESLRKRVGIVTQNIFLFHDSILNNIKYSRPNASIGEVIEAAERSGCHEFIARLKNGYDTDVGEIGKRLSGGEKQLISIARCLLLNPDIIIFDEPTTHLDRGTTKKLIVSIQKLFKDKTCIIISHNLENISWTNRIFVLDNGRLLQEGTHEELIKNDGVYKSLYGANNANSSEHYWKKKPVHSLTRTM
jgi:ABC-type bacteriocin/lantibiotic exporter with double-glycine peptidase domain